MTDAQKLDWTYCDGSRGPGYYTAEYRGFTIKAVNDESPENPFDSWDCEPPTLVWSGRRDGMSDYSDGALDNPLAEMTTAQVSRHWRAICDALNWKESDHESDVREAFKGEQHNARKGYQSAPVMGEVRRACFANALDDARPSRYGGSGTDYLQALATLWNLAGVTAETWSSHGYSQGDWAEGLSVATPDWAKATGAPKASHAGQCKAAGKLWGAWAWGDVYGFVIVAPSPDSDDDEGDDLDSCWGYYGTDFQASGLEESARDSVDSEIQSRQRRRTAKLGELIRARVPLQLRPAILDATASAH